MTHKNLEVWHKSIKYVTLIYKVTNSFPKEEMYGLTSQIRRCAISIPSNIAEGAARRSKLEFRQFLYIALSSGSELETQIIISRELNFINATSAGQLLDELSIIAKMVPGLIKSLNITN